MKIRDDVHHERPGNMELKGDAQLLRAFPNLEVVSFCGYSALCEPLTKIKSTKPGTIISKTVEYGPHLLPSLSRRMANTLLRDHRLEVLMEVRVSHHFTLGYHVSVFIGNCASFT